jgi:tyrosinase
MFGLQQAGVIFAITSIASAYPSQALPALSRRQNNNGFIETAGVTINGTLGYRKEIHALQADEDAWNMYLLGLSRFMDVDGRDPMSYYQIAAIHGQPYVAWDNNGPCDGCQPAGYCTHQSTLFPTWHRAYLALFEQALVSNAMTVAKQYTGEDYDRYMAAAEALRIPFWDWAELPAEGENPFPQMFTDEQVFVNSPNGPMNITNPLGGYQFKSNEEHKFIGGDQTERKPTFTEGNRRQLRSDLWSALSSDQAYNAFSTEALASDNGNFNPTSLEALHDNIHVLTGGHMGIVPQAAYDPVFWLHHTNVDRVFAIYQAAYPDKWIVESAEVGSNMWYTSGTVKDGSSGLEPFHSTSAGELWVSDDVRDTRNFNYVYDDLYNQGATPLINSLYGDQGQDFEAGSNDQGSLSKRTGDAKDLGSYLKNVVGAVPRLLEGKSTEYIASIEVDAMRMNGSFTVYIFDGEFDKDDASEWYCSENLIGSHGFFAAPMPMDTDSKVRAGISITDVLFSRTLGGFLDDLTNGGVTSYLKNKIDWRIVDAEGCIQEGKNVPGLHIDVISSEVEIPKDNSCLPKWGKFDILSEITAAKNAEDCDE